MKTTTEPISPCPFCGSPANLRNDSYPALIDGKPKTMPWFLVQCTNTIGDEVNECGAWQSGPTEAIALAKWNRRAAKPFPLVMGQPISREDVIEGLRDNYHELCKLKRRSDPTFRRYPDVERLLDHIEQHGIPPRTQN